MVLFNTNVLEKVKKKIALIKGFALCRPLCVSADCAGHVTSLYHPRPHLLDFNANHCSCRHVNYSAASAGASVTALWRLDKLPQGVFLKFCRNVTQI